MGEPFVDEIRERIASLDVDIEAYVDKQPELGDLCQTLLDLNIAKQELGIVYDRLVHAVSVALADRNEQVLPDGSIIEKKWSSDRRGWQHKALAQTVAHRLVETSVDMDTGEILATPEQLVAQLLDFVQPSYWRVKQLGALGINADNYCEVGETKTSIIVRKAKS